MKSSAPLLVEFQKSVGVSLTPSAPRETTSPRKSAKLKARPYYHIYFEASGFTFELQFEHEPGVLFQVQFPPFGRPWLTGSAWRQCINAKQSDERAWIKKLRQKWIFGPIFCAFVWLASLPRGPRTWRPSSRFPSSQGYSVTFTMTPLRYVFFTHNISSW